MPSYQNGGWYNNPADGNRNERFMNGGFLPFGQTDPSSNSGGQSNQSSGGANYTPPSAIDIAKQLQQLQIEANQPAIQSLQASISPLQDRYKSILDSIKGQGTVAQNAQTLASNNTLGKRGILPSSSLYQQTAASDLLPVTTQFAGLEANTGLAEQQDINGINQRIGDLQSGNVGNAITGANGIASIAAQLQQAQATNATSLQNQALQQQYQQVGAGNTLYNTKTNSSFTPGNVGNFSTSSSNSNGGAGQLPPLSSFVSSGNTPSASSQLTNPGQSNNSLLNMFGAGGLNGIKF